MLRDWYSHWIRYGQNRPGEGLDVQVTEGSERPGLRVDE